MSAADQMQALLRESAHAQEYFACTTAFVNSICKLNQIWSEGAGSSTAMHVSTFQGKLCIMQAGTGSCKATSVQQLTAAAL